MSSAASSKSQDKTLITKLERKLKSERENRANLETQLKESKKKSSSEHVAPVRVENHDSCNAKATELEQEVAKLQRKLDEANQSISELKKENGEMRQKDSENETGKMKKDLELLTNALTALQGKNVHLENSLSSETRLKLDLFSALGDTRRQLEIVQGQMKSKCLEVDILNNRIAEVMAVMPTQFNSSRGFQGQNEPSTKSGFLPDHTEPSIAVTSSSFVATTAAQNGVA